MGTRINILFSHNLSAWNDRNSVLEILRSTDAVCERINNYFGQGDLAWVAKAEFPVPETRDYHRYVGTLFVEVNPTSVRIRSAARWLGFVTIPELREVHVTAFYDFVRAFDASEARCFPDQDDAVGAFWDGATFSGCCEILDRTYGRPRLLTDQLDPDFAEQDRVSRTLAQYSLTRQK